MLEPDKINKLIASFRERLERMNKNGDLDVERGLSDVIESLMQDNSEFQAEAIEEICGITTKKKPVTNAEILIAILESGGLQ